MIRERRNKSKLHQYYKKFIEEGILDLNVHPWVAESWQRCKKQGVRHDHMPLLTKLTKSELAVKQQKYQDVIKYIDELFAETKEHFNVYNLSLLLIDSESYVLKNYALPFYQRTIEDVEGAKLTEAEIGTSSISIAKEHKVPFLLFGPEMWIAECQSGDACSVPIIINGQVKFIISVFSIYQEELPYNAIVAWMLTIKNAVEKFMQMQSRIQASHLLLDALPMAVYHVRGNGDVAYANKLGKNRLGSSTNLNEAVLNYRHIPLQKAFEGIPSYNKEITWLTTDKAYEDVTTVIPVKTDQYIESIIAISVSIEELKTMIAHATGYSARYSLASLVGETEVFSTMLAKATRAAKGEHFILLQGEPGTGKQRLAHGIHQASIRAAEPLISVKCGNIPADKFDIELFGLNEGQIIQGKLELANGGTLFLDEIEKMPVATARQLAQVLETGQIQSGTETKKIDVRVIAACDSNLKRLADKGMFSPELYEMLAKTMIRIAPLRERQEDIPILAQHIIAEIAEQHSMPGKTIVPEAMYMLRQFSWPGNIKQLQGVLERAFFHTAGNEIRPDSIRLPREYHHSREWKHSREAFIEAWRSAGGNISRLASMLNVSRVTLYRYLRKYELDNTSD